MDRAWLALALLLAAPLASGQITLVHTSGSGSFTPVEAEVPFGQIVAGTTLGANETNASVSIAGSLVQTTTDVLYLNNTNQTGVHHAKLELVSTTEVTALDLVRVGIDNGTASTDQIEIDLGAITTSEGSYVQLEPGSTNTIYVTQSLGSLTGSPELTFWVYSADDTSESAYVKTRAKVTLT